MTPAPLLAHQRSHHPINVRQPWTAAILDFKWVWSIIKIIAKITYAFCYLPYCSNDKRYDWGKDLSLLNFSSDEQKRKRTPSLENTQVNYLCPPASFPIQNGGYDRYGLEKKQLRIELVIAGFESRDLRHTCTMKHNSKERLVMSSDKIAVSVFSSTNFFTITPRDYYLLQKAPLSPMNFFFSQKCMLQKGRGGLGYNIACLVFNYTPRYQIGQFELWEHDYKENYSSVWLVALPSWREGTATDKLVDSFKMQHARLYRHSLLNGLP